MVARVLVPIAATLALTGAAAPSCDDTCRVDAARAYVSALVTHDPVDVPLHPEATRVEAGLPTGFSGEQIRADLRFGPQYRVIQRVRDEFYAVDGDVVTADFVLDVGLPGLPLTSARVHETFTLDTGQLRTIVADIALGS